MSEAKVITITNQKGGVAKTIRSPRLLLYCSLVIAFFSRNSASVFFALRITRDFFARMKVQSNPDYLRQL